MNFIHTLFILSFVAVLTLTSQWVMGDKTGCINCNDYLMSSAAEKASRLWYQIQSSAYSSPYPTLTWPGFKAVELFSESMNAVFDQYNDQLPQNRKRLVHANGCVGLVSYISLIPDTDKYTGIYKTGSKNAIMRLSLAGDPSGSGNVSPGFAIKFLRDGQYSGNLIGMFELTGNGKNYNFFSVQLKTKVATPTTLTSTQMDLQEAFEKGATPSDILAVDTPSVYDEAGTLFSNPKYPEMIYLVPSQAMKDKNFAQSDHDFRYDLASISNGTDVYDVYATDKVCMCGNSPCQDILSNLDTCQGRKIGIIRAATSFIPSEYGDESIFFQHSRWTKKSRLTCTYKTTLDAAGRDSTVLPADPKSDCQSSPSCVQYSLNTLVSSTSGCPFDAYLKSADTIGGLPTGAIIGIAVGSFVLLLALIFFIVKRRSPSKKGDGFNKFPEDGKAIDAIVVDPEVKF